MKSHLYRDRGTWGVKYGSLSGNLSSLWGYRKPLSFLYASLDAVNLVFSVCPQLPRPIRFNNKGLSLQSTVGRSNTNLLMVAGLCWPPSHKWNIFWYGVIHKSNKCMYYWIARNLPQIIISSFSTLTYFRERLIPKELSFNPWLVYAETSTSKHVLLVTVIQSVYKN